MTLEVYKYITGSSQVIGYDSVAPGDYMTIINRPVGQEPEIIVANCRPDNKLSHIRTIHPDLMQLDLRPPLVLYKEENTENRVLLVRPGEEQVIDVRERVGKNSYARFRYRFSHR